AQPMLNATPPDLHALAVAVVPRGAAPQGVTLSGLGANLGGVPLTQPAMAGQPGAYGGRASAKVPAGRLAVAHPAGQGARDELRKAVTELRRQAQLTANEKKDKDASELANYAAVLEQACDLAIDQQKARGQGKRGGQNEGPSVTYHLTARLSVPSRTDEQVIE